jgi:hypothetical protein
MRKKRVPRLAGSGRYSYEEDPLALPVQGEGSPAASPDGLPCGDLLQAFVDKPKQWDAWNIDADLDFAVQGLHPGYFY